MLAAANVVICATNEERQRLNGVIRQHAGFGGPTLYRGEPLMCWRNDLYKSVYNGTRVTVREDWKPGEDLLLTDHRDRKMRPIANPLVEGFGDCPDFTDFDRRRNAKYEDDKWIWFPFTLGYACTVHKAQGSEWDKVLVVLRGSHQEDPKFLYTAITRAREKVTILHLSDARERVLGAYTPEEEEYDSRLGSYLYMPPSLAPDPLWQGALGVHHDL